jgi:hypothetical protein
MKSFAVERGHEKAKKGNAATSFSAIIFRTEGQSYRDK